ncbi:MAG TPA: S46 family peptidase, partial [Thermoanaerobaculia bacterium]|nr:S46 family peptidase [Thermoanaerobaculia bacterium]
ALEEILAKDRARQERRFFLEETERNPGFLFSALQAARWAEERAKPDLERDAGYQQRDVARARDRERNATKSLAPDAQRKALAYLIAKAMKASAGEPIAAFGETFGRDASAAAIEKRLAQLDASTKLADESVRLANLEAPLETLKASGDSYVRLALALSPDLARVRTERKALAGALLRARPVYLSALREFRAANGRLLYPDANSTLRISFAEVKGYAPREALLAEPQTSTKGLLEKETGAEPFASPARVLAAVRGKRFGRWEDARLGGVPIGFLSNADTTGGNSGSPAVNGKGELVGLNFDRVWENVAGDFGWNPERSRNVMADVRYALWLIGDVDGQAWLVDELLGK